MIKKISAMVLAAATAVSLCACTSSSTATQTTAAATETAAEAADPVELIVFAAASMTETLTELGNKYMEANPGTAIVFNFDSSGTLKTQIQEGADVDIFISAGQKQMNQLDITADAEINKDGLDFVLADTTFLRTRSLWQFRKETPLASNPMMLWQRL